jgi:hypothetical protein
MNKERKGEGIKKEKERKKERANNLKQNRIKKPPVK